MCANCSISADLVANLLDGSTFGVEKRLYLKDSKATELEVLKDDKPKAALSFVEMSETRPAC